MTINLEEVYDHYRKGDFTDRLNIYLQFPELRNDFLEIEQKEKQPCFSETAKSKSKRFNRINKWIGRRFSLLW